MRHRCCRVLWWHLTWWRVLSCGSKRSRRKSGRSWLERLGYFSKTRFNSICADCSKNMHWIEKCDFVTVKTCKNRFNCAYILKHIFCILYIYQVWLHRSASNKTTELFVLDHLLTFTESLLASPTQDCSRGREPEPETCGRGYCLHGAYWWPADKWASGYFQVTQEE